METVLLRVEVAIGLNLIPTDDLEFARLDQTSHEFVARRPHGWQPPHEHHPYVIGRGAKELPAEKSRKLVRMDVGHPHPLQQRPDLRIIRHPRPLDRGKHQGLEADGAVFPVEGPE